MFAHKTYHCDQNWQGLEIAYNIAYSDKVSIVKSWEWVDFFSLRSVVYPVYLSLPLHVLRFLGLDYNILVVNSIYVMNLLLFVMGDYYLYKLSDFLMGKRAAQLALLYSLFNCNINTIFQKTMTNGAEAALSMSALYYYTQLRPKFDKTMILMTLSITWAFIFRSSCLLGWVPLALIKLS